MTKKGPSTHGRDRPGLILGGDAFNTEGDTPWSPPPVTSVERLYPAP